MSLGGGRVPADPKGNFLNTKAEKDAICQLPEVKIPLKKSDEKTKVDKKAAAAKQKAIEVGKSSFISISPLLLFAKML